MSTKKLRFRHALTPQKLIVVARKAPLENLKVSQGVYPAKSAPDYEFVSNTD